MEGAEVDRARRPACAQRCIVAAIAGLITVGALLLTPVGSELGLVGSARASTDIDPCGGANESTTPVNPALGFEVGSGPAALQCGPKETNFPLIIPEDVSVKAPDAGTVDPAFKTGFPYMIGPDGAEVSYTAITGDGLLKTFLESLAGSLTEDAVAGNLFPPESEAAAAGEAIVDALVSVLKAVISDLIQEEEALQGADWDWTVPSNTATGDWYSWFTWPGTGGALGINPSGDPAITPSSVNPALVNWYSYNPGDSYYQSRSPAPYARVYLGATRVTLKQGPGITAMAESLAGQESCTPLPSCLGAARRSARPRRVASRAARGTAGLAIHPGSSAESPILGTSGNDEFRAEQGDLKILAGAGHDQVLAGRGANRVRGGRGHDDLMSLAGGDRLEGNSGHDLLQGGPGPDVSIGGGGSDSLFDAKGRDRMVAGSGDDRIVVRDRAGDDVVDCGPGTDMVIANPGDRIVGTGGASAGAAQRPRIAVGAFTRAHTPKASTCERVYSSVHMPPRKPPSIGHAAGRPPGAPEPAWPVFD
jgi:RTX calcium-binding nonapeptide repeat (4 copies)